MRYYFKIIFTVLFIYACNLYSQPWIRLNAGTSSNLWGVSIIDENNVWVVGDAGYYAHSSDGGMNWSGSTSGSGSNYSVKFLNNNLGWMVGDYGYIQKTTDGGSNWITQYTGVGSIVNDICVYDSQKLWVFMSSNYMFYSSDGGDNWTNKPYGLSSNIWDALQIDENTLFAVGVGGLILKTTDGGDNWNSITSGTTEDLWNVNFPTSQIGYISGANGVILKTTDGGNNWSQLASGFNNILYGLAFRDENTGWAVGASGKILKTTDGGNNWVDQVSGTSDNLTRIEFVGETGIITASNGNILKYYVFKPLLGSLAISDITNSSAKFTSSIFEDGFATISEKGFVISKSSNPTISNYDFKLSSGSGTASFSDIASNLELNTKYFVRAFATNSEGTSYSVEKSFTTLANLDLPNNGDGNGDGIADSLQTSVVTILSADSTSYITVEEIDGKALYEVWAIPANDVNQNFYYPYGLVNFKVNSNITRVKMYYHNTDLFKNVVYRKLNSNGFYINFNNVETGSENIGGQQVATITFSIEDGGIGDYDNIVNGIIHDPGGPAVVVSANIPSWNYLWLSLAVISIIYIYYKKR